MASLKQYTQSLFSALRVFRRALLLVWRSAPRRTMFSTGLNLLQAALPLGVFYLTKLLIDRLVEALGAGAFDAGILFGYLLALSGIWLLNGLAGIAAARLQELHQLQFNDYISGIIQEKSVRLDLAYYENPDLQDTFHKTQYEAIYRPWLLLQSVHNLLQSGFYLLLVAGFLFTLSWWLLPALLLAGLPGLLGRIYYANRQYDLDRQRAQKERESWYLHELLTLDKAARELRLFRFGDVFRQRYQELRRQLYRDKSKLLAKRAGLDVLSQISEVGALGGLIGWVALRTAAGALSVGALVMYLQAFQRGMAQLRSAITALAGLHSNRLFLSYLFDFLDLQPRVTDPPAPKRLPADLTEGFLIEDLHFRYPGQEKAVLSNVNLRLPCRARIAVVGPNGSGKSTLIKLLARYYDPDAGRILLDGIDLRDCAQDDLRSRMSIVFQDFNRYPFSAAENIRISDLHRAPDADQIREAARLSGAAAAIERLPHAYDTRLGYAFNGGVELSGGQWQQVAVARAFYADKSILILDEPMSAIDPLVEQAIFEEIFKMDERRLIIFITHRLYHLQKADSIIVMDEGQVAEQGSFETLMHAKGLFYRLFNSQQVAHS